MGGYAEIDQRTVTGLADGISDRGDEKADHDDPVARSAHDRKRAKEAGDHRSA